jgi:hypothetical protein
MPSLALSYVHINNVCTAMIGLEHTSDDVSATGIILITTHILKNLGMHNGQRGSPCFDLFPNDSTRS